jgi:hypothetical protein
MSQPDRHSAPIAHPSNWHRIQITARNAHTTLRMLVTTPASGRAQPTSPTEPSHSPMPWPPKTRATPPSKTSRRSFCGHAASLLLAPAALLRASSLPAQPPASPPATPTRPDVAAVDRDRILAAAQRCLTLPPTPLTTLQSPRSPGTVHDYYSEAESEPNTSDTSPATPAAPALHRPPRRPLHPRPRRTRPRRRALPYRRRTLCRTRRPAPARMVPRPRLAHGPQSRLRLCPACSNRIRVG